MSLWLKSDFSLKSWMQEQGLEIGKSLTTALANQLLKQLGITKFLKDPQCDRQKGVYIANDDGWNKGINQFCLFMRNVS